MSKPKTFIKNNPLPGSHSLICERKGLETIDRYFAQHGIKTPKRYSCDGNRIEMESIISSPPNPLNSKTLGAKLAKFHQIHQEQYGLDYDNFIGLSHQKNTPSSDWGLFFWNNRLDFQLQLLSTHYNHLKIKIRSLSDSIVEFLNENCPPPTLLHGDLWSGNVIFTEDDFYFIDPALYWGDPQTDLAMMSLFGGFDQVTFDEYHKVHPKRPHHNKRQCLYQLYHQLNHLNIFGKSYLGGVERTITMFESKTV